MFGNEGEGLLHACISSLIMNENGENCKLYAYPVNIIADKSGEWLGNAVNL